MSEKMTSHFTVNLDIFSANETRVSIPVIPDEIIEIFSEKLGLLYIPESTAEGRVCFAASPDVRPEYKDTFALVDLQDYVLGFIQEKGECINSNAITVAYPINPSVFWQSVKLGRSIRERNNS